MKVIWFQGKVEKTKSRAKFFCQHPDCREKGRWESSEGRLRNHIKRKHPPKPASSFIPPLATPPTYFASPLTLNIPPPAPNGPPTVPLSPPSPYVPVTEPISPPAADPTCPPPVADLRHSLRQNTPAASADSKLRVPFRLRCLQVPTQQLRTWRSAGRTWWSNRGNIMFTHKIDLMS